MKAIVTVCNKQYQILLPFWLGQLRKFTKLPIFVLALKGTEVDPSLDCQFIPVSQEGNPFPSDLPDHACAEKQRIFHHIPESISQILFLDIDVMVLGDFWSNGHYFSASKSEFVASPDLFVGYKEKMEDEFNPFDSGFRMKYFPDGVFYYFNTGVFFASRNAHYDLFDKSLKTWASYVELTGHYPSIFDQNVFNYCLIKFDIQVRRMPIQNNCLRQYWAVIKNGNLFLNGEKVNVMHFNGGEADIKLTRWLDLAKALEVA